MLQGPRPSQSLDHYFFDKPCLKGVASLIAIVTVAATVLGASYGVCSFTSLAHKYSFFSYLSTYDVLHKVVFITINACIGASAFLLFIYIHGKRNETEEQGDPAGQTIDNRTPDLGDDNHRLSHVNIDFSDFDPAQDKIKRMSADIRQFLMNGYTSKTEYYTFYYNLASVTESVMDDEARKVEWQDILTRMHGTKVYGKKGSFIEIDCSFELRRLKGEAVECEIKKVDLSNDVEQREKVSSILVEAFDEVSQERISSVIIQGQCYIIFDKASPEKTILGCIFFLKKENDELFIHSLARRAAAVKFGLTERLSDYLKEKVEEKKYKAITCEVADDNTTAIAIYRKLGFKTTGCGYRQGDHEYIGMKYDPDGEDAKQMVIAL